MPSKKTVEEEACSERVAAVRGDLAACRKVLLHALGDYDVISLDTERVLRKIEVVSSRRITKKLMLTVLEEVVLEMLRRPSMARDAMMLFGEAKQRLIHHVDRITANGNVVLASSKEAKRRRRDSDELKVGGQSLLSDTNREVAEAYWQAIHAHRVAIDEGREIRRTVVEDQRRRDLDEEVQGVAPTSEPIDAPRRLPGAVGAVFIAAGVGAKAGGRAAVAAAGVRRGRASLPKKDAYRFLSMATELFVTMVEESQTCPSWDSIEEEMRSRIDAFWAAP